MKKYILGAVFSIGLLVSPAFTQAAALTTTQANSLIAVVQSAPGVPASAFVNLITSFSSITVTQATSLIGVVQSAPGAAANAFVDLLISFTNDTTTTTTTTSTPTITVLSPNGGEAWKPGETHTIRWTSQGENAINYPVQIGIIDTRIDTRYSSNEQTIANSVANTGSYSWTIPQSIQTMNFGDTYLPVYKIIIHSMSDSFTGHVLAGLSSSPFAFTAEAGTTNAPAPSVTIANIPTLSLSYDSAGKEASLTANYNLSIRASSESDFKLYKYNAWDSQTYALLVTLRNMRASAADDRNPDYYKVAGNAIDNGNYWDIPAGQTATFNVTANLANPKTLFAGSYSAALSLYKPSGVVDTTKPGIVGNDTTNYVTIVGEVSPYISSITSNTDGIYTTINGVRLGDSSGNTQINYNGQTKTYKTQTSNRSGSTYINFRPSDFGVTGSLSAQVQIINPSVGNSNIVWFNYTAPTTTAAPAISCVANTSGQNHYVKGTSTFGIGGGDELP